MSSPCSLISITTATGAAASPLPPAGSSVGPQASQVVLARRKLKQTTLNKPSCLCLLSVWHMKDMWLYDAWRPYQAHARQNDLARKLHFRVWKQNNPSGSQETDCACGQLYMRYIILFENPCWWMDKQNVTFGPNHDNARLNIYPIWQYLNIQRLIQKIIILNRGYQTSKSPKLVLWLLHS